MRKVQIIGVLIVTGLLFLGACAPAPTPPPFPPPPSETPAPALAPAPEDIIPLSVPGFEFIEKSDRVEPLFEGEEYSALSFFTPKANTRFENKVDHMTVKAHLFKDEISSNNMANLLQVATSVTEIQFNGETATLTYKKDNGETIAFQQQARLVIYSLAAPPFESTMFDENVLKEAAIEGLKAINR